MIGTLNVYIWLFIHRPFEAWPVLGETLRMELCCAILVGIYWISYRQKSWTPNILNVAFFSFVLAMLVCCLAGPCIDKGLELIDKYYKYLFVYIIVITTVKQESQLRSVVKGFLVATALYMAHSLWEFMHGRHEFRMGIARMIGVDAFLGDPNAFAGTIVYALPITFPFWSELLSRRSRLLLAGYWALSLICILLTGSRGALVGLIVLAFSKFLMSRRPLKTLALLAFATPFIWLVLPADLQNRFLTLYDPSYGPANAKVSADSRSEFFWIAVKLFEESPVLGYGPNSFWTMSQVQMNPHNLYAQLISEMGLLGVVCFCLILAGFVINHIRIKRLGQGRDHCFPLEVSRSVLVGVATLLVLGMGGHNLYRYQWLWFGAFQIAALSSVRASQGIDA